MIISSDTPEDIADEYRELHKSSLTSWSSTSSWSWSRQQLWWWRDQLDRHGRQPRRCQLWQCRHLLWWSASSWYDGGVGAGGNYDGDDGDNCNDDYIRCWKNAFTNFISVSVHCKDTRIVVNVGTNKPFSGRIYALGRLALVKFQTIFHNHYSYRLVVPVIESQAKIFFLQKRDLQRWCHQQRHIQVIIDANGDDDNIDFDNDADDDGNDWWQKTWSCRKVIVITP